MSTKNYDQLTNPEKNAFYFLSLVPSVKVQKILKRGSVEDFRNLITRIQAGQENKIVIQMTAVLDDEGIKAIIELNTDSQIVEDMVNYSQSVTVNEMTMDAMANSYP